MKLVKGSKARATANLILRAGPGTGHKWLATIQRDVLMAALENPVAGWVKVSVDGWANPAHPGKVYSEPDERSSVDAVRGVAQAWQAVKLTGYVSTRYLAITDGPT